MTHPFNAPGPFVPLTSEHASTVLEMKKGGVLRVRDNNGLELLSLEVLELTEHASTVRVTVRVDALPNPGAALLEKVRGTLLKP